MRCPPRLDRRAARGVLRSRRRGPLVVPALRLQPRRLQWLHRRARRALQQRRRPAHAHHRLRLRRRPRNLRRHRAATPGGRIWRAHRPRSAGARGQHRPQRWVRSPRRGARPAGDLPRRRLGARLPPRRSGRGLRGRHGRLRPREHTMVRDFARRAPHRLRRRVIARSDLGARPLHGPATARTRLDRTQAGTPRKRGVRGGDGGPVRGADDPQPDHRLGVGLALSNPRGG